MKKIILLMFSILLLSGCGKTDELKVVDNFINKIEDIKSYSLNAEMEILSNEETYHYDVEVHYLNSEYYKVRLYNQTNDHEQIILKNTEGVYAVTPALNKSFKFQSEWPNSSSQSYLLNPIIKDIENDKNHTIETKDKLTILTTSVNYPNNPELTYQKITFNESEELTNLDVYNKNDIAIIKVKFTNIDYKAKFDETNFNIDDLIQVQTPTEETTNYLDEIIYPLYIPTNTYLKSQETIDVIDGNRAILTFSGEKNFVLVEEVSKVNEEFEIIPVYGDPLLLSNTVGAITANSLTWTSNNIDYYIASNDLTQEELLTIANSLNNGTYVGK